MPVIVVSLDWFKGKSTGNHRFFHEIWDCPINFPLHKSIDGYNKLHVDMKGPMKGLSFM